MARLAGKVAVITGGSSGIGLATAQRFVDEGAHVFIVGRRQSELDKAKALIGDGVSTLAGDVTVSADLDRLLATVLEQKGVLDVLVVSSGRFEHEELGKIKAKLDEASKEPSRYADLLRGLLMLAVRAEILSENPFGAKKAFKELREIASNESSTQIYVQIVGQLKRQIDDLKAKGQADQVKSSIKDVGEKVKDAVADVKDSLTHK